MGLNDTPKSERIHIGIFGRRNAGKSSVINAITGQNLAIVSDVRGTTTDPVYKSMELLPMGPVTVIDTPGLDDEGELGCLRIRKSYDVLNKTDVALLIVDAAEGMGDVEKKLEATIKQKKIPYIIVYNKIDENDIKIPEDENAIGVSAKTKEGIFELKEKIAGLSVTDIAKYPIVSDLINPLDFVVLVVPIDSAAPKGRLILPQQQTIREVLESDATAIVVKETELKTTLENIGKKPKLVITDSQAFENVAADTPEDILLTSFSILFARHKGNLAQVVEGAAFLEQLKDGDTILISEGCTHHRQCDDIGTVKLPRWIKNYTGKDIKFEFSSGTEFPTDLSKYKMVVHCGGCMLNEREVKYRMACCADRGVPITNYGILIAYIHGILKRSVEVFPDIAERLSN